VFDSGKEFISALLTKDKDKRPSAEAALQLPWIQQAAEA
jgi:serine/threonine protein kinase